MVTSALQMWLVATCNYY